MSWSAATSGWAVMKNASSPFSLASTNADSCWALPEEISETHPFGLRAAADPVGLVLVDVLLAVGGLGHELVGAVEEQPAAVREVSGLVDGAVEAERGPAGDAAGEVLAEPVAATVYDQPEAFAGQRRVVHADGRAVGVARHAGQQAGAGLVQVDLLVAHARGWLASALS